MECGVAIQIVPQDTTEDAEVVRVVDAVIAYIKTVFPDAYVGPFETAIEGDYDTCMEVVKNCQLVAAKAGSTHISTYVKISYKPGGSVLTTEQKVGKYHPEAR